MSTIKVLAVLGVAGWMIFGNHAQAQIPVTDGASIAQQVAAQVETIAKWKMQYDQMMDQINQAKQQYEALTGSRGLGTIMNNPALRDYLPGDWQAVYDAVKDGGYPIWSTSFPSSSMGSFTTRSAISARHAAIRSKRRSNGRWTGSAPGESW